MTNEEKYENDEREAKMMYRRSWPAVIITLIAIGVTFLGFGILIAYYMGVMSALELILLGLAFIVGGIGVLFWYIKKKRK